MNTTRLAFVLVIAISLVAAACNKSDSFGRTPTPVDLIYPENGSTGKPDTLTLSCNTYTRAMHYYFFVTNVATHQMTQYTTDTPAVSVALQAAQTYNWQVSVMTLDSIEASSTTWSFTTR